jgi:hypothetical protein
LLKKNLNFFWIKNYNLLNPGASIKDVRATEKALSLKTDYPALESGFTICGTYKRADNGDQILMRSQNKARLSRERDQYKIRNIRDTAA